MMPVGETAMRIVDNAEQKRDREQWERELEKARANTIVAAFRFGFTASESGLTINEAITLLTDTMNAANKT